MTDTPILTSHMGHLELEWRALPAGDGPVTVNALAQALRLGPDRIHAMIEAGRIDTTTVTTTVTTRTHTTTTTRLMIPRTEAQRLWDHFVPWLVKWDDWWNRHPGAPWSTGCSQEAYERHQDERWELQFEYRRLLDDLLAGTRRPLDPRLIRSWESYRARWAERRRAEEDR